MVALIATKSKNNVIKKDGLVLWDIKDEQKIFTELTMNNTIIMDRETFDDIGRPFPNRLNLVISNNHNYKGNNIITVHSLEQALYLSTDKVYIIGNYNLYKESLSLVDIMYITEVNIEVKNGDILFPSFNEEDFDKNLIEEKENYKRYIYTRKYNNK